MSLKKIYVIFAVNNFMLVSRHSADKTFSVYILHFYTAKRVSLPHRLALSNIKRPSWEAMKHVDVFFFGLGSKASLFQLTQSTINK